MFWQSFLISLHGSDFRISLRFFTFLIPTHLNKVLKLDGNSEIGADVGIFSCCERIPTYHGFKGNSNVKTLHKFFFKFVTKVKAFCLDLHFKTYLKKID